MFVILAQSTSISYHTEGLVKTDVMSIASVVSQQEFVLIFIHISFITFSKYIDSMSILCYKGSDITTVAKSN